MNGNFELIRFAHWRADRLAHWGRYAVRRLDGSGPAFFRIPDVVDTVADRYGDLAELLRAEAREHELEAYHAWAECRARAAGRGR